MMEIKKVFGILLFVQILAFTLPQSSSTSTFGKEITAESKLIHSEDFIKDGDMNAKVTIEKTIKLKQKIDSIRLISFNGVINVVEGGVNHDFCKIEAESYSTGLPIQARIEIYRNGAIVRSLSMVLVAALCMIYYAV